MRLPRLALSRRSRPSALAAPLLALALVATGCGDEEPAATPVVEETAEEPLAEESVPAEETEPAATPSDDATGGSPDASPGEDAAEADVQLSYTITDGTPEPAFDDVEVPLGSAVALTVTSDVDDSIHIHGLADEEVSLPAGEPVTLEFVADQAGAWEVETHGTGVALARLVVQ